MKRRRFLALAGYGLAAAAALPVVVAEVLEPPEADVATGIPLEELSTTSISDVQEKFERIYRGDATERELREWGLRPCEDDVQLPLVEVRR